MSKFLEYLKLIPKGLKNPEAVLEGWLNDIKLNHGDLPKDQQDEILKRRLICSTCSLNSTNAKTSKEYYDLYKKNYESERLDLHCSVCSCPILKKTASLQSNCGLETYNEINTDNKQPLKWEKYQK